MSTVFIVQEHLRRNRNTGELEPAFDLSPAASFGSFRYLLGSSASPFNPDPIIKELHDGLKDYTDDDYLLLTGNPILIGMACSIAADNNDGHIKMLQWSGTEKKYIPVVANLFPFDEE